MKNTLAVVVLFISWFNFNANADSLNDSVKHQLRHAVEQCLAKPPVVMQNIELDISPEIQATQNAQDDIIEIELSVSAPGRPNIRGKVICKFAKNQVISSELISLP